MDKIKEWVKRTKYKDYEIEVASEDASFRKYYRLIKHTSTFLVMDSSHEMNSLKPFLDVTSKLSKMGVTVPEIYEKNLEEGFLIIEDFGDTHFLDILEYDNHEELYKKAIDIIVTMQEADTNGLPLYDKEFLHSEMDLMQEWYLEQLLPKKNLSQEQTQTIKATLENISKVVLSQPQSLFVHRDFHSRNIMLSPDRKIGIIDYQDAMSGAITYDLVSLLKDVYVEFQDEDIHPLVLYFRDKKNLDISDEEFIKWFDFMSMQRHLKILGVFARLYIRDNKKNYLKDIPLTLKYLFDTSKKYEETKDLTELLKKL
jgi:aminoglycoside/choline kinase family phosphotransferase